MAMLIIPPLILSLILGKATLLQSQFRLTYNMILNLLRVEDLRVCVGWVGLDMGRGFNSYIDKNRLKT